MLGHRRCHRLQTSWNPHTKRFIDAKLVSCLPPLSQINAEYSSLLLANPRKFYIEKSERANGA